MGITPIVNFVTAVNSVKQINFMVMRKTSIIAFILFLPLLLLAVMQISDTVNDPEIKVYNYVKMADRNLTPSVDHTKFAILKEPFWIDSKNNFVQRLNSSSK